MDIEGKRIRKLDPYLGFIPRNTRIVIGLQYKHQYRTKLLECGFKDRIRVGDTVLPSSSFGPISRYNAEGKYISHKDKPKETAYRMVEWHWREWRGRYEYEDMHKMVDVPYERYPRSFIEPPSVELQIVSIKNRERCIVTPVITYSKRNEERIIHIINLFLEIFRMCTIYNDNLDLLVKPSIRRLNWHILPPGRWPWTRLEKEIRPIIRKASKGNRSLIEDRIRTINGYSPEFVAVGKAGFRGYIIFAFPSSRNYVLESIYPDNATYVFDRKWERLSKLTKAEILDNSLHKARFIHRVGWHTKIHNLLT